MMNTIANVATQIDSILIDRNWLAREISIYVVRRQCSYRNILQLDCNSEITQYLRWQLFQFRLMTVDTSFFYPSRPATFKDRYMKDFLIHYSAKFASKYLTDTSRDCRLATACLYPIRVLMSN